MTVGCAADQTTVRYTKVNREQVKEKLKESKNSTETCSMKRIPVLQELYLSFMA
jgi:hypothetical protein